MQPPAPEDEASPPRRGGCASDGSYPRPGGVTSAGQSEGMNVDLPMRHMLRPRSSNALHHAQTVVGPTRSVRPTMTHVAVQTTLPMPAASTPLSAVQPFAQVMKSCRRKCNHSMPLCSASFASWTVRPNWSSSSRTVFLASSNLVRSQQKN